MIGLASRLTKAMLQETRFGCSFGKTLFQESQEIWRAPSVENRLPKERLEHVQSALLSYLQEHCHKHNISKAIELIDKFCLQNWMPHFGPEKCKLLAGIAERKKILNVLEIGGYCGYSSLSLSQLKLQSELKILSLETNKNIAQISRKILAHTGVTLTEVLIGELAEHEGVLQKLPVIDLLLLSHGQPTYLSQLFYLQKLGLLQKGSVIVADGLLTETNTDYMMYMREIASNARLYKSTMFATYQAYTDLPDAVLVSDKL